MMCLHYHRSHYRVAHKAIFFVFNIIQFQSNKVCKPTATSTSEYKRITVLEHALRGFSAIAEPLVTVVIYVNDRFWSLAVT